MPALPGLLAADVIFLQPVEVLMLMARIALAIGHRQARAAQMHAVGLGSLEKRDMLKVLRRRRQRLEQIAHHRQVGLHLLAVAPSAYQVAGLSFTAA